MTNITENMIERPFDFLQYLKNREVVVIKKDKEEGRGILLAFDMNLNLVLENNLGDKIFIKGDTISDIVGGQEDEGKN